jgi:hypothetical protein
MEFNSKEELRGYLLTHFTVLVTDYSKVVEWLEENGFQYSELTDDIVYASKVIKKRMITITKLLIRFVFTPDKLLKEIIVDEGVIAP